MQCTTAQEQMHRLVAGELSGWQAGRLRRHCAVCPACRQRQEQAAQVLTQLQGLASMPTPERVRASVFAQIPADVSRDAAYHISVSMGTDARGQRRQALRRLVGVGGVTLALGVTGILIAPHIFEGFPDVFGTYLDQQRVREAQRRYEQFQNLPPSEEALRAKVKLMREHWKPWAIQQKPLMQQMLKGDAKGFAALMRLYDDVPATLPVGGDGLTMQDLNAGDVRFSWQPGAKLSMTHDYNPSSPQYTGAAQKPIVSGSGFAVVYDWRQNPLVTPGMQPTQSQTTKMVLKKLKEDYARQHDMELSCFLTASTTNCTFWFSGRVTETTQRFYKENRKWKTKPTVTREIFPPYEELTR